MAAEASAEGELPPGEYMEAKLWTAPEHQPAKAGREREARGKDQEELFQALEDDKAKVGPGKSRQVSRSGAAIRVDVERASKLQTGKNPLDISNTRIYQWKQ